MSVLDASKNFAKALLSTGYNSAATSIVLATGGGAKFPAQPFNAVWWDATLYLDPSDDPSVEVVRVTGISTDTLTVTRAQESTSAANHNTVGHTYMLAAGPTAKLVTDLGSVTDDTTTNATMYPVWATAASGNLAKYVSSTKLAWNPSTGNFGIGTAPAYPLHAQATESTSANTVTTGSGFALAAASETHGLYFRLRGASAGIGGSTYVQQIMSVLGSGLEIYTDNAPLVFGTNSTERMRILATGEVGIGTTAPVSLFEIKGTADIPRVTLSCYVAGAGRQNWGLQTDKAVNGDFCISYGAQGAIPSTYTPFYIKNTGEVGINTTAPATTLDVNGPVSIRSSGGIVLSNGRNDNVAIAGGLYNISGPTGAFSISGLAGGHNGQLLTLISGVSQAWTILHYDSNSTAANRILTSTGTTVNVGSLAYCWAQFIYFGSTWQLVGHS